MTSNGVHWAEKEIKPSWLKLNQPLKRTSVIIDRENPTPIDLLTVYDVILAKGVEGGEETTLKLQLTYGILAY